MDAGDLELVGVLRGMVKRAGRSGRHPYVRTHQERASRALAWLYDALKDATLVPRATINPTMITAEAPGQERRRILRVKRPPSGRPKPMWRGSGRWANALDDSAQHQDPAKPNSDGDDDQVQA